MDDDDMDVQLTYIFEPVKGTDLVPRYLVLDDP